MSQTAATPELKKLLQIYTSVLPLETFPYIPFIIAAIGQSFAWMSGPIFLAQYTLVPRVMILILFAIIEYIFMSPAMNASVEILNMSESFLVTLYHVTTLIVFIFINVYIFNKGLKKKDIWAFLFISLAVYFAHSDD